MFTGTAVAFSRLSFRCLVGFSFSSTAGNGSNEEPDTVGKSIGGAEAKSVQPSGQSAAILNFARTRYPGSICDQFAVRSRTVFNGFGWIPP